MPSHCRWILTGASGWFGRTALWEYEQRNGPEALRRDVCAFASTSKEIDFGSPHGPVKAMSLESLNDIDNAKGLIHLAFLTRDRIAEFGVDRYVAQNRTITSLVADCINRHPGIPIITTSSGVAKGFDATIADLSDNPYAALKQEEEELWRSYGNHQFAAVFRVYAAAGRFIKDPRVFALSDFLSRALSGERIEIYSKRSVVRSYVHVGTMMRLFWAILDSPPKQSFCQVDAVLETVSLTELANIISQAWDLPEPLFDIDLSLPADDYTADSFLFLELLRRYRLAVPDFMLQLSETASYLARLS
ncbi:NAD-dependent epimerase/dehydratase family protein [bacterium]|nr:NAD-dependent epimerase/dehydratase family protein [bacterium]